MPNNALERALARRTREIYGAEICFDQSPPASFVNGFSCFQTDAKIGAELMCFRAADLRDVQAYKDEYRQKFEAPVRKYLAAAKSCRVSNGDSAIAYPTTFPALLSVFARFEFGFINSLGTERPSDSYIQHGYAATDPSISSDLPSAIEYIYMLVNAPRAAKEKLKTVVGDWLIRVFDSKDLDDNLNEAFRKSKVRASVKSVSFDLERGATTTQSQSAKLALIARLLTAIGSNLEDEGFSRIPESVMRAQTGKSSEEFLQEMTKSVPYGARQNSPVKLAPTFLFFVNEKRPTCTRNGAGAMAAYLFATEPIPYAKSDYGSISVTIAGFEACARSTVASTRTYIDGLLDDATRQLLASIERH